MIFSPKISRNLVTPLREQLANKDRKPPQNQTPNYMLKCGITAEILRANITPNVVPVLRQSVSSKSRNLRNPNKHKANTSLRVVSRNNNKK